LDTQTHLASDTRPNTVGMPLRWQTSIETPAASLENQAEALTNTTYCGLLKQTGSAGVI
jgi:hypothetical protein